MFKHEIIRRSRRSQRSEQLPQETFDELSRSYKNYNQIPQARRNAAGRLLQDGKRGRQFGVEQHFQDKIFQRQIWVVRATTDLHSCFIWHFNVRVVD